MAALREIIARFGVTFDDRQLQKGDKAIGGVVARLGKLGGLLASGFVIGKIASMGREMLDQADALAKQAAALGVSTKELQEWQHAANLSGVSGAEFSDALRYWNKNLADSTKGTGPAAEAIRALGVNATDSAGKFKEPIALLDDVAAGIEKIQSPAKRTQVVMNLFGRSGAKLLPLFSQGSEGIKKLRAEVDELGGGFTPDFAKRSEEVNDSLTRLNLAWLSFKVRLGGLVLPLITRFVAAATKATAGISKWIDKIGLLESGANLAAAAAVVLGTAFLVAGLKAIAPWLPMLVTFAALILLVDELITLWQGGDTLIGRAIDSVFGEGTQKQVTRWLQDVVKENEAFFSDLEAGFADVKTFFELLWFDLTTTLTNDWQDFTAGIELMLFDLVAAVKGAVADVEDEFAHLFNKLQKIPGASKVIGKLAEGNRAALNEQIAKGRAAILSKTDHDRAAIDAQRLAIASAGDIRPASEEVFGPPPPPVATARAGGKSTTINDHSQINITVPPGTQPNMLRQIGDAVKRAKGPSNKAKMNALVKVGG